MGPAVSRGPRAAAGRRRPRGSTARPVNDRNYDVALHVVFDGRESHDAYQIAPRHLEFIAEGKENWKTVRVFDSDAS